MMVCCVQYVQTQAGWARQMPHGHGVKAELYHSAETSYHSAETSSTLQLAASSISLYWDRKKDNAAHGRPSTPVWR
jgi:hypothetical protein